MPRIYLAGPDVFHPDARELGRRKAEICVAHGFNGVFPLDVSVDPKGLDPRETGLAISQKDERLLRSCHAMIVNLTPYHGPSMDVGSAVELGIMRGLGRPIFGYSNAAEPFEARVRKAFKTDLADKTRTSDGMRIESFGLTDNLMVDGAILASGGTIARAETKDLPFGDLSVFARAVAAAAHVLKWQKL